MKAQENMVTYLSWAFWNHWYMSRMTAAMCFDVLRCWKKKQASLTPQYLDVSEWVGRPVIREELHKLHLLVDTDTMYHITVAHLFENKHHMKLGEWVFFSLICYCISYASHHHPLHHTWEAYSNCVAVLFICQHFRLCLNHNFFLQIVGFQTNFTEL